VICGTVIPHLRYLLRLAFALFSEIPTQVVVPSVSRAAMPHGTALTVRVDPSGATTFKPGPTSDGGSGPVE